MGKRSTRITPKVRRRVKRVSRPPEIVNEIQEEGFSTEENRTNKRQMTTRRAGRTATKRKAEAEKETVSSRYSSSSSVGNESQEESVQVPKKKRYKEEESKPTRASKSKKSTANKPSDALTKTDKEKAERAGETRTVRKISRKQRQTFERIKDLIVTKKVYSKWKPLGTSTKDYIKQVIADTVPKVISNFSSEKSKEEVQHCLSHLGKRINAKMNQIKGPSQQTDYRDIEQNSKGIEESLTSVNSQLSIIEDELQEQRRLLEEEEKKLKTLMSQPTKEPSAKNQPLHPILKKSFTPSLDLPTLSKKALNLPIPKIPPEVNKGAERLSKTLSELSNTMDNVGLTQWLESVSQLQSSLNQS